MTSFFKVLPANFAFAPSFFLFLICYFLLLTSSQAINLKDAIKIAQVNNRSIKLEKIKLNLVKNEKTKAIAEFLPHVSASVGYGQRNSFYNGQNYDRSSKQKTKEIKLEQPIFDGLHSVSKYQEANYKIKSSSAKTSNKIQEISLIATQSYCNLFRYQETIKLQKENQKLSQDFFNLAKRRKDLKIIDRSDIIKFNYEFSLIEEKYLNSLNQLNKAKFEYQNVIGELHENLIEPKISEEYFDFDKVVDQAISSNHNIKSQHYNYLASKFAYRAEKSNFFPKISITASNNWQDKVVYLNNQDLNSQSIFLNLSIPIFQKGLEYANLNKARYDQEIAMMEYEITKEEITKEINQMLEEYKFLLESNKANKKLFEISKQRAEIFNKRSKLKIEDPIEAIRVNIESNDRKINYINSQIDLVIAHYKIKYFLGEIES